MATDYAALVTALYAELGTWELVATGCEGASWRPRRSYYHSIAKGAIKRPSPVVRRRIVAAYIKHCCDDVTAGYRALGRPRRYHVSLELQLGERLDKWREKHRMTWNQWATKAHALMRDEYGDWSGD